jgi:hypothetical protein
VLTGAALCPATPLLWPQATGRDPVVADLRDACAHAVRRLVETGPDLLAVIGPARATGEWDPGARLDPSVFAPGSTPRAGAAKAGGTALPPALGLGAFLLDQAGYGGQRRLQAVGTTEPAGACAALGRQLRDAGTGTALLVMGDGSARRTLKAPGYLDSRAGAFDAEAERAVRECDFAALSHLDQQLAQELMVTGWPAWQALAGAAQGLVLTADVLYCDAPFGVGYIVASIDPGGTAPGGT